MEIAHKKIGNWNAIIFFDKTDQSYTITNKGKGNGGAIISYSDISKAENKFIDAMHLAESLRKLIHFTNNT